jgi:hypothetical protein
VVGDALGAVVLPGVAKDWLGTTNISGVDLLSEVVGDALGAVVLPGVAKDSLGILVLPEVMPDKLGTVTVSGAVVLPRVVRDSLDLVVLPRVVRDSLDLVVLPRVDKDPLVVLVLPEVIPNSLGIVTLLGALVLPAGAFKAPLGVLVLPEVVASLGSLKVLGAVVGLLVAEAPSGITVGSENLCVVLARFKFRWENTGTLSKVPIPTIKPTAPIFSDKLRSLNDSIILKLIFFSSPH